jgi:hypothetical protein
VFDAVGKHHPTNGKAQEQRGVIVGFHIVTSSLATVNVVSTVSIP